MKPSEAELQALRDRISGQQSAKGYTYAQIARDAELDAGHAYRICRGEFKTINNSVLQVCKVLEVDVEGVRRSSDPSDPWRKRIKRSVEALWDGTPEDARRIEKMCATIAELRSR